MMQVYQEDGLVVDLASARVCQDIVLMAIANRYRGIGYCMRSAYIRLS